MTGEMNSENSKSLFIFTRVSVSVCVPHCVPGALRGQTSALDRFPELEVDMVVGCHVSTRY